MADITTGRREKHCAQSSPTGALNGKRPRPTALFPLHATQAGQVAFAPNPALPKDQLLRGSWRNACLCFTPTPHQSHQPLHGSWRNVSACFTLHSHQSHQPLHGRWRNVSAFLLQLCSCYTNHQMVDGVISVYFYSNSAAVTPTATRQFVLRKPQQTCGNKRFGMDFIP